MIIVDEVHAYDAYMTHYMPRMLDWLGAYRTSVILLSATLPGQRRAELVGVYLGDQAFAGRDTLSEERAYPLLTWTDGRAVHTRSVSLKPSSFYRVGVQGETAPLQDADDALDRWELLWHEKRFPEAPLRAYLTAWRERFYLWRTSWRR